MSTFTLVDQRFWRQFVQKWAVTILTRDTHYFPLFLQNSLWTLSRSFSTYPTYADILNFSFIQISLISQKWKSVFSFWHIYICYTWISSPVQCVKFTKNMYDIFASQQSTLVICYIRERCNTHRRQGLHRCYLWCQHSNSLLSVGRQSPCDCLKFFGWFRQNLSSPSTSHMHEMASWNMWQGAAGPFRAIQATRQAATEYIHTTWAPPPQIKADNSRENK